MVVNNRYIDTKNSIYIFIYLYKVISLQLGLITLLLGPTMRSFFSLQITSTAIHTKPAL